MLWDVVYSFFIKYIFGGTYRGTTYNAFFLQLFNNGQASNDYLSSAQINALNFNVIGNNYTYSISFGNYLSLIATIISMVAIVLICCALIKKIYNMCAHIIG